jgi:hypothetical protein
MQARKRVQVARSGGRARARNLSPDRRREIAQFARLVREQKSRGEFTSAEFIERLVVRLRSSEPDLALYVKAARRLPIKYQKKMPALLSEGEKAALQQAHDEVLAGVAT